MGLSTCFLGKILLFFDLRKKTANFMKRIDSNGIITDGG